MKRTKMTKWLVLILGLSSPLGLQAQSFLGTWNQTSPAVTTGTDTNGTFVSTAPLNTSVTFNSTESSISNPQMLWVPARAAFRVGGGFGAPSTTTMGSYSVATGQSKASGYNASAFGYSIASGSYSVAAGNTVTASGESAVALGGYTTASGMFSTAMGGGTVASGQDSTAMGVASISSGTCSTAIGFYATASSYVSTAMGTYNVGGGNATTWVATDPLFEVGNGTGPTAKSNAFVIYKNGDIKIPKPQGDISMGEFAP